jgi:hypothetical protein
MKAYLVLLFSLLFYNGLNAQLSRDLFSDSVSLVSIISPLSKLQAQKNNIRRLEVYGTFKKEKDSSLLHTYFFDSLGNYIQYSIFSRRMNKNLVEWQAKYDYTSNRVETISPWEKNKKRKTVDFYLDDSLINTTEYAIDSTSEIVVWYKKTYYDSRKLLSKIVVYDKHMKVFHMYSYSYDENKLPQKIEETDSLSRLICSWLYENRYDKHGRIMDYYYIFKNEKTLRYRCYYNQKSQCVKVDCFDGKLVPKYVQKYEYDNDGIVCRFTFESMLEPKNSSMRKQIFKYHYSNK